MKLNIFCIPASDIDPLRARLLLTGLEVIQEVEQAGWKGSFYYSSDPNPIPVSWAKPFAAYFPEGKSPFNRSHFATFVFSKGDRHFALSYGKAHFYVRPYCDYDFGVEVAKRIANQGDIRQTASRRYQGRRKRDIKSFTLHTSLDIESGESVDYIQATVIETSKETFGKTARFGSSILLTPDIPLTSLGAFLDKLEDALKEPGKFKLPRTDVLSTDMEIEHYDEKLKDELLSNVGESELAQNSYDLWGVDFVFASDDGEFTLSCPGKKSRQLEQLTMRELKEYIVDQAIARDDVLKIKIRHEPEDAPPRKMTVKESVDFIVDADRVVLSEGRWMRFNQDYLDFLNDYLAEIPTEDPEAEFERIVETEPVFNASDGVHKAGYETADKNFDLFKVPGVAQLEAWDLQKGDRVYAVKFATAQKLGYVCDQAMALLEARRNHANQGSAPAVKSYCLWLGYRGKKPLGSIVNSRSLILKQKIEAWARACRDQNIEPVLKISLKLSPIHDRDGEE